MNKSVRVLVSLTTAALVAACSSTATTPPSAAAPTVGPTTAPAPSVAATPVKQNVTIEVMASQDWIKPSEQVLAGKFEAQTGIHLDFQIIPSANYFNVLQTKLNSGQGVDLFLGQAGKSDMKLTYKADQNAVDLTNEAWAKTIDPVVADQSSLSGKLYGAEVWDVVGANYWVMSYNMDIFKANNLTVPKTFAEFETVCDTLKAKGITPIYEPISDGWHQVLWFPTAGAQMNVLEAGLDDNLNANKTTFAADAVALKSMTQFGELYTKGYFGPNALSAKEADTSKAMVSGKFAMTLSEISRGTQIEAASGGTLKASSIGYFPVPLLDNQLQPAHPAGPTWMISSKSKNIDAAKAWLAYMTQPDTLQWLIDNTPDFQTLPFASLNLKAKWDANQTAFFGAYALPKTVVTQDAVTYFNPQWMDIGKDEVSMFTGKMKPADVLKAIDTRRTTAAKTAKDPAWP